MLSMFGGMCTEFDSFFPPRLIDDICAGSVGCNTVVHVFHFQNYAFD